MTGTPKISPAREMAHRLCVAAGAGSGKTTVLIDRILHLLDDRHADLDEIVAITFTEAAAAEMKVRLRKAFHEKAPKDDPDEMSRWRNFERRADMARLSTIHSFCASLIRENAFRAGWDPDFAVLAEAESVLLRKEVVEETVHTLLEREARPESGEGPATRAAASLGPKELHKELISMLNHPRLMGLILDEGLPDDAKAIGEHWRRLIDEAHNQRLLELRGPGPLKEYQRRLEAFAGICKKPDDRREAARRQLIAGIEQINRSDDAKEIKKILEGMIAVDNKGGSPKSWGEEALGEFRELQKELRKFVETLLPPQTDPEVEARAAELAADIRRVYESAAENYRRAKAGRGSADFDDLIQAAYEMLRDNNEVRARTARGIKFLLIDEFQDTDSWQLQIARLLADHPEGPSLFIVGDAKQSIYDFRGAEVEVFQNERASAPTRFLENNYRTLPDVLHFINETFERSELLRAVENPYTPLAPYREPVGETRVEFLLPLREDEKLSADAYRSREAEMIAARLDELVRGPRPAMMAEKDGPRLANFGDAVILFRAMSSVYIYEEALRRRGIPYHVVAGRGFYQRQEIIDLRNLLAVVVDPCDEMALLGFLRSPLGGLSDEALAALCSDGGLLPGFNSRNTPEAFREGKALNRARDLVARLRARMVMPLPAFLRYALDETGFEAAVLSQFLGLQKAYNARKAIDLAQDFSRLRPATLASFLRYLDQAALDEVREGDAALQPEGAGAVTLMSVHKSKGLEFPIVCVADLARHQTQKNRNSVYLHRRLGLGVAFPDRHGKTVKPAICQAINDAQAEKDEAERARMLYVAMTRARDWLILSGAPEENKSSWMTTFDGLYGVCAAEDTALIRGASHEWSAIVRRKCPAAGKKPARAPAAHAEEDPGRAWEALAEQAAAPHNLRTARRMFSVAEILDALTETADPEEATEEETPAANAPARDRMFRGTLVHRMFELWDFKGAPPVEDVLAEVADPRQREKLEPDLRAVAEKFTGSGLSGRFAAGGVRREIPFCLNVNGALVQGVIDAMAGDGGVLVDYKTGRPGGATARRYELQLCLYAAAVQKLLDRLPDSVLLYYADHGKVHEVAVSERDVQAVLKTVADVVGKLKAGASAK